jgi:hypothetical protein
MATQKSSAEFVRLRCCSVLATLTQLAELLAQLAAKVKLAKFRKHRRGPKKPPPKRDKHPGQPHVSKVRLLAGKKPRR